MTAVTRFTFSEQIFSHPVNNKATTMSSNALDLNRKMSEMPRQFKKFSAELLSLYNEKAPGGGEEVKLFINLRDDVRDQAIIYREGILPVAVKVVTNISDYFDNYRLGFDVWQECLEYIIEEAHKFELACILLRELHMTIIATLKKHRKEAEVAIVEMKKLSGQLWEKSSSMGKLAKLAKVAGWVGNAAGVALAIPTGGASLAFNVGLGAISVGTTTACNVVLQTQGNKAQAIALAAQKNAELNSEAAETTENNLIQAISDFVEGLNEWEAFFNRTKSDLSKFREGGETARQADNVVKMKLYYHKMEVVAKDINTSCKGFISSIGDVSTFLKLSLFSPVFVSFLTEHILTF
jgi:hypothetical protein